MKNQHITIILLLLVVSVIFFKLNNDLKDESTTKQQQIDSLKHYIKQDSLFVDSLKMLFKQTNHKIELTNNICNDILSTNETINLNQKEMFHSEIETTFYLVERLIVCRDSIFKKNIVKTNLVGKQK